MSKRKYAELLFKIYGSPKELKEGFIKEAMDWKFYPIYRDNETVALFMTKGCEIHCGCLPNYKGKWFPMKMYNRIIKNLLLTYGKVTTSTFEESRKFVERLGFKEVSKIKDVIHYIKKEV